MYSIIKIYKNDKILVFEKKYLCEVSMRNTILLAL